MEKQAVIKPGVTHSEISGKPSKFVKNGQALAQGEKPTQDTTAKLVGKIPTE